MQVTSSFHVIQKGFKCCRAPYPSLHLLQSFLSFLGCLSLWVEAPISVCISTTPHLLIFSFLLCDLSIRDLESKKALYKHFIPITVLGEKCLELPCTLTTYIALSIIKSFIPTWRLFFTSNIVCQMYVSPNFKHLVSLLRPFTHHILPKSKLILVCNWPFSIIVASQSCHL